ncbi:SPARC-related modular calcium-binding protein 2 isoform X3 [Zophobas morio]|uniref:SPARC-related modular calcium-binding protein 2 isoform X3 n=1 Tax=Zophobas morio TaxID=2755281 RepID=UPI003082C0FB
MWLHTVLSFGCLLVAASCTEPPCNPKACSKDMDEKNVCGSDGLTYPNRCHLEKVRCVNKNLTLTKRGPCRQQKACRDWEVYRHSNPDYKFQANCRPDGSYAAAQCHPDTGFCWCVTPQGVPLPYTSVRWKANTKPHCGRKKKSAHRRSPRGPKGRNRACKQPDKAKFNNNLINIFHTEWSRDHGGVVKPHNNETDLLVNQWKFGTMDADGNGVLDRNEYRDLKRIAKKAVKPKKCAKMFPRSCDVNSDTLISQQEWAECLTRDGMDVFLRVFSWLEPDGGGGANASHDRVEDQEDYPESFPSHRPLPHALTYDEESSEIHDEDEPTDCLSDRQAALLDGGEFYVPECTSDGRYKKIQCYKAAEYCFCVHEDTGQNIPGTSVKNGKPQCDQPPNVNRPMKGCPFEKKTIFLRDLLQFLHVRMKKNNDTKNLNSLPWMSSKEEQAATWSFVDFDKNKNKLLDRNEWKLFKEVVSKEKSLRKCGKKLPRYCDINKDRHISMTEWMDCLNVQKETITRPPMSPRTGKKNPLDVLMED